MNNWEVSQTKREREKYVCIKIQIDNSNYVLYVNSLLPKIISKMYF